MLKPYLYTKMTVPVNQLSLRLFFLSVLDKFEVGIFEHMTEMLVLDW